MDGRIASNLGRERHTIGAARHNQRNDARPFDVELLPRRRRHSGNSAIEKQPIGGDVRPVPRDQEDDDELRDEQRAADPTARQDVH